MTNRELSWIENQLQVKDLWKPTDLLTIDAGKWFQVVEALKAAREALWSCEIHSDQHRWFDEDLLTSAIAQIDALGEEK